MKNISCLYSSKSVDMCKDEGSDVVASGGRKKLELFVGDPDEM